MERKSIGAFICALRKANGLTQRQLADELHVSDKAVSRWERDESAPDLTLIPVIADIFGITSDELLRGERLTVQSIPESHSAKTDKHIQYLLNRTLTKHKIYCFISGTVALLGLIAAVTINQVFLKAHLAFFVGLAFFIIATLCQTIFLILGHSAIDSDENYAHLTYPVKRIMILTSELTFGLIMSLSAGSLPLIFLPDSPFQGLSGGSWLLYGIGLAAFLAVIWGTACALYNRKRGLRQKINWHSPANQLRLRWFKKTAAVLLLMLPLYLLSIKLIDQNYHLLVHGKQFTSWDDFRRYMETPTDTDGTPLTFLGIEGTGSDTIYLYENQMGQPVVLRKEDISQILYNSDTNEVELVRYRHLNRQITSVRLNQGNLPAQVFTVQQLLAVQIITALVHLIWVVGMIVAAFILRRRYLAEKRK